jgi:hypothetical protein
MPKLVMDEAAMQLAVRKLGGLPIYDGPGGAMLEPGVVELDDDEGAIGRWQPADRRTKLLTLAVEACQDVVFHGARVLGASADRRAMRAMVVPTCNLMDSTDQLLAELNGAEQREMRSAWRPHDQATYKETARRLRKSHLRGPVRTARNAVGAHLDADAYEQRITIEPKSILSAFGDSLILLLLSLNHESHSFGWIRGLGASPDGQRLVVETMFSYPLAVRWLTDSDGRVLDVGHLQLAADPRTELQDKLLAALATYNALADQAGAPRIGAQLHERPTAPPDAVRLTGRQ